MRDFVFQVVPKMNYDAYKEHTTFKKYFDKVSGAGIKGAKNQASQQDKIKMVQLNKKLAEEQSLNQKIIERRNGEQILYGEEVQLLHYDSRSFLEGSKSCADIDKSCNLIKLNSQGSKSVCFVVQPRYKYRNEGSPVNYGDVVVFRNMKSNQYLHISLNLFLEPKGRTKTEIPIKNNPENFKNIVYSNVDRRMLPDEFAALYEVNTASNRSNFTIRPYRRYYDEQKQNIVKGGSIVRFLHSESGGYICSDDNDFTGDNLAEVFLWNYKGKSSDIEALSTQTFFELEIVTDIDSSLGKVTQYSGNSSNESSKKGGMHFRLRHMNTGRLVVMQELKLENDKKCFTIGLSEHLAVTIQAIKQGLQKKCTLTCDNPEYMNDLEQNSIFRLISTGVDMESGIISNTSVQIQHVLSGRFLHHNKNVQFNKTQLDEKIENSGINLDIETQDQQKKRTESEIHNQGKEILNQKIFQELDQKDLELGSRDLLSLEESASFENAFFMSTEPRMNIERVLFVHTSVNCLNNLLSEISRPDYGYSKDRQNKIEGIVTQMIDWIEKDDEENLENDEGTQFALDLPYSLKNNDEFARKNRLKQIKQKFMREMRVIECLVDILYMPFASGAFEFTAIKQEDAITQLCRLIYELLSKIVYRYRLNEIYAAQWIGLFINHIQSSNDQNEVGADQMFEQLCDENDTILDKMITRKILEGFFRETEKGKEQPRMLKLLKAICASQNGPIKENQNDILQILLEDEESRLKLLMPLKRIKSKRPIEICLDLRENRWADLVVVMEQRASIVKSFAKAQQQDPNAVLSEADEKFLNEYDCFICQLDLLAECCLNRNQINQNKLKQIFEAKILRAIFLDKKFAYQLRAKALKLFNQAYLDVEPFKMIQVPSGFAVWKSLPDLDFTNNSLEQTVELLRQGEYQIKKSKTKIPKKIMELALLMEEILQQQGIIDPSDQEKSEFTIEVLKTLKFMILHGFYQEYKYLSEIAQQVVLFLNGANTSKKKKVQETEISQFEIEMQKQLARERYFPVEFGDPIIESKLLSAEILLMISNLELDAKCNTYLSKLKNDIEQAIAKKRTENSFQQQHIGSDVNVELTTPPQTNNGVISIQEDLQLLQMISEVKGYESYNEITYVAVLFDLLLYRQNDLQCKVFKMLINYFTRQRIMIECLSSTQILESGKSIETMDQIKKSHLELKKQQADMQFWLKERSDDAQAAKRQVSQIFQQLTKFCILDGDQANVNIHESESEDNITINQTQKSFISDKKKLTQLEKQKEKTNQIEQYMIFDIDKNNATPNKENQRLMQSFDISEIALIIIKQKVDRVMSSDPEYIELIKSCYRFLVAYTRNNFQNQLKIYDDVDVFMRDIDKYQVATLLFYEIFKDNKKFLTLNVTKFIRAINNTAEEVALSNVKKAIYLKLLEVFCRYEKQLIKQNQIEIIIQMTADITRSNVLYLFQAEGAKELGKHVDSSLTIKTNKNSESMLQSQFDQEDGDASQRITMSKVNELETSKKSFNESKLTESAQKMVGGVQKMSMEIFNVIQLLKLVTLCCTGKSEFSEMKCKENILNFKAAVNMIKMSKELWPLKIALFEYIIATYMDSSDPNFMKKPSIEDQQEEEEVTENTVDDTDVGILLRLIEILNADYEAYLSVYHLGKFNNIKFRMPNGSSIQMQELNEKFIYGTGLNFIKATLKRKTYDVGSVELKFYVLAKKVAETFWAAKELGNIQHQKAAFDLLDYIFTSEKHVKYLDNVKHPAKKGRQNKQIIEELGLNKSSVYEELEIVEELTNSNRLSQRINQLANCQEMQKMKNDEFTKLVDWITNIGTKIGPISSSFINLNQDNIIGSILRLLDARLLTKELQITGLSILRKIIEMENNVDTRPSADWDTQSWVSLQRKIQLKQIVMVKRGTIQFLCKHISENEDPDVQEECILVCIAILLGGNSVAQQTFFEYMKNEDPENKFLLTIRTLLVRNFELTKKFMIEKNAKLQMIYKFKQRDNQRNEKSKDLDNLDQKKGGNTSIVSDQPAQEQEDDLLKFDIDDDQEGADGESEKPISIEKLEENVKKKYLAMTIRILRFLQLLCSGHYTDLQNNLREQINSSGVKSVRSFDFVAYVSNMFTIYVKSYVNCYSTTLGNQIIESLVEFIQGPCAKSQRTLVDTKAIDCCRDLLNQGIGNVTEIEIKGFGGTGKQLLNHIKMNCVKLLLSILEGPVDPEISSRISASLGDFEIIIKRMEQLYYQFLDEELKLPINSPESRIQSALQKDSFDGCILEGFDIYSLLNQLVEVIPEDEEKLKPYKDKIYFKFYVKNSGNIEVNTEFDVLRIYFPLQPKCRFLTEKTKAYFTRTVERESGQHKLIGLCENIPKFEEEMEHLEVMSHQRIQITPQYLNYMRDLSTLLAVAIGATLISTYKYQFTVDDDTSLIYDSYISSDANLTIFGLGCVQALTSFMLLVGFLVNSGNLIIRAGWRERVQEKQLEMLIEKKEIQTLRDDSFAELQIKDLTISQKRIILQLEGPYSQVFYADGKRNLGGISMLFEYYWISLTFMIQNGEFLFMVMYFVFSIQGLLQSPVFYSFHLLDVVNRFPALQNVIKSVTLNGNQILMTGMLGAIIIYNFAIFAFLFTSDNYFDPTINAGLINKNGDSVCFSLLHCYLSAMDYGLRFGGGIGDFLPVALNDGADPQLYIIKFFNDLLFFLIITTIILNVFFGIIIDSFAQLREEAAFTDNDIKNICYICNLDRFTLDKDTELGFDHHTETDHFLWNYVYFIIHLKQKHSGDFNGTESAIFQLLLNEDMSWFPQHKSIRMKQTLASRKKHDSVEEAGELEVMSKLVKNFEEAINGLENV